MSRLRPLLLLFGGFLALSSGGVISPAASSGGGVTQNTANTAKPAPTGPLKQALPHSAAKPANPAGITKGGGVTQANPPRVARPGKAPSAGVTQPHPTGKSVATRTAPDKLPPCSPGSKGPCAPASFPLPDGKAAEELAKVPKGHLPEMDCSDPTNPRCKPRPPHMPRKKQAPKPVIQVHFKTLSLKFQVPCKTKTLPNGEVILDESDAVLTELTYRVIAPIYNISTVSRGYRLVSVITNNTSKSVKEGLEGQSIGYAVRPQECWEFWSGIDYQGNKTNVGETRLTVDDKGPIADAKSVKKPGPVFRVWRGDRFEDYQSDFSGKVRVEQWDDSITKVELFDALGCDSSQVVATPTTAAM